MSDHDRGRDDARDGDEAFAGKAGDLLRRSADDLDAATASRLNRVRQAALDQMPRGRRPSPWQLPALSAAAVGALAVGLWLARDAGRDFGPDLGPDLGQELPTTAAATLESAADLDLLLAADSLEMLEDLEFYAWLDPDRTDAELRAELESTG